MPVRPFYDPTFDPGQAVAVTYWTTFVGTRSKLNQERMAARLRQADPKFYQEQIDAIQSNINELIQDKARAGRDAQLGFNRFLDSYTRAEGQRRKAIIDAQAAAIDAQARVAAARIGAAVDIAELSSEEKRAYAEAANIQPQTTNNMLEFLSNINRLGTAEARNQLEQKIAKYMEDNGTSVNANKGQLILAQFMDLAEQQGIDNEAFNDVVGGFVGGSTSAQVRNRVGALYVEQDDTRIERILSMGGVPSIAGAGGGAGGAGGAGGDLEDDVLFKKTLELLTNQDAGTQADFDRLIAEQRQRLQRVEQQQQEAQDAVSNFYTSSTGNPLLQPVFTRAARRGRLGQQQEVIDASAANLQRDPTGTDFAARSLAASQADGDITGIDPLDVEPQGSTDNILDDESGEFLFSHIYRQLSSMRSTAEGDPAGTERRLLELYDLAMKVPSDVRARYPDVFSELDRTVRAVVSQTDDDARKAALQAALSTDTALQTALVAAHNQGDIHNAAIIADAIGRANNDPDLDSATDRISEIAEYAEASGELGGELGRALSRLYNEAVDAGDGVLLRQHMSNIERTADRSMDSRTDDEGRVIPPDIGVTEQEAFIQSVSARDARGLTLEEDLDQNVPIDPIANVATNLTTAAGIQLANPGLSEANVQRALQRNLTLPGADLNPRQQAQRAQLYAAQQPVQSQRQSWQQQTPDAATRERLAEAGELGSVSTQQEDVMTTLGFAESLMPIIGDVEYRTDLSEARLASIERDLMAADETLSGEEATRLAQLQIGQELLNEQREVAQRYRTQAQQAQQRLQQMREQGPPELLELEGFEGNNTQGEVVWPPPPPMNDQEAERRAYFQQLEALQSIAEESPKYADSIDQAAAETQRQMQEYQPAESILEEAAEPEEEPSPPASTTTRSRSRSTAPAPAPAPEPEPPASTASAQPSLGQRFVQGVTGFLTGNAANASPARDLYSEARQAREDRSFDAWYASLSAEEQDQLRAELIRRSSSGLRRR